jgi:hypothetical protein
MTMIAFEPVWICTDEHIRKFHAIYRQADFIEKMFGAYNFPPGYPYMHMGWGLLPFYKFPLVFVASGIGWIQNDSFYFQSRPFNVFGYITRNLLDLKFGLGAGDQVQVTRAKVESPVLQYYSIPFTRLQTKREGLLSDFLVCAGGLGPFTGAIVAKNDILFQNLEQLWTKKG